MPTPPESGLQPPIDRPRRTRLLTGTLLVALPLCFMGFFMMLQVRFDYPDILRAPAAEVLTRFDAAKGVLLPLWYGMFASSVLFIALAALTADAAASERPHRRGLLTPCLLVSGVLAGLVQAIGLGRWVFVVPHLAGRYTRLEPGSSDRGAIEIAFEVLNRFVGVGIGEHLGYLFTGVWTLLLASAIRPRGPRMAAVGAVCGLGIIFGMLEPVRSFAWAGTVNAIAYSTWSVWLVVLGILVLRGRSGLHGPLTPRWGARSS